MASVNVSKQRVLIVAFTFFLTQLSLAALFGSTKYSYGVMLSYVATFSPVREHCSSPLSLGSHVAALLRSHLNGSRTFKVTIQQTTEVMSLALKQ